MAEVSHASAVAEARRENLVAIRHEREGAVDSTKESAVPRDGEGDVLTEAMPAQARANAATEPDRHGRRIRRSRKKGLARALELTVRFVKTGSIRRQARYLRPKL